MAIEFHPCSLAEGERQVGVDVLEEDVAVRHHAALRVNPLVRRLAHDVQELKCLTFSRLRFVQEDTSGW